MNSSPLDGGNAPQRVLSTRNEFPSKNQAELQGEERSTRRGRERFNETSKIQRLRQLDRRLDEHHCRSRFGWRQHESDRSKQGSIRIGTTRHRASHHSRHVMPAIHVIRRRSWAFMVMMRRNRALTGQAASGLIRFPRRSGEWRVKQNDHQQADACVDRTPSILAQGLYVLRAHISCQAL